MSKYVAYVSSYTQDDKYGISIYDVDMKKGRFSEKSRVEVSNSSYITISHNQKFLYSIKIFGLKQVYLGDFLAKIQDIVHFAYTLNYVSFGFALKIT